MVRRIGELRVSGEDIQHIPYMHMHLKRPLFLWNLMIRDSINHGLFSHALQLYASMFHSGLHGNSFTFPLVFKACSNLTSIDFAIQLHSHVFRNGFHADLFVQTALIDMYSSCSRLASSIQVFDEMPIRSLVSWNSIISAYSRAFRVNEAFSLLKEMWLLGLQPSSPTFVSILSGCCHPDNHSLFQCLSIHGCAIKLGLTNCEIPLANSLLNAYLHFGQMDRARFIFNNIEEKSLISWTTIIGGYFRVGNVGEAFSLFSQMRQTSLSLDSVLFVILVSGCAQEGNLFLASSVHSPVLKTGSDDEEPINHLLVTMYANCGDLVSARKIFDMANDRSISLWTSMIGGYTHLGYPEEAFNLFRKLLSTATKPTGATLAIILSAYADLQSLSMGKEIEEYILMNGLESDTRVQTSLIHMFCRCGAIKKAREVFERVTNKDLVVWSSMINGYATHGMGEEALSLFHNMQSSGIKPDSVVYKSILTACSHSGLVADGMKYFHSMQKDFGIQPTSEHYACLVDLLGRAGQLNLAVRIIQEMPVEEQALAWGPLLSACRTYCNIELGEFAAKKLLDLNPESASNCVLVANLYTSVGKWEEAATTRRLIKEEQLVKERGWSQIEINGCFHVFVAGDRSHPQSIGIYNKLEEVNVKLREAGYSAQVEMVTHDLEKEEQEATLEVHSERLAVAFGLIATKAGTTLRIIKNLRTCGDCHSALKIISKVTSRLLIVRDGQRFHHFESGSCSCKDYW